MFETIVWATDGSELADRALPVVTGLARAHRSKIVAIHVTELLPGRFGTSPALAGDPELVEKVERQIAELRRAGFTAELRLVRGTESTAALLAQAAADADASLIVLGTRGHGALASALVGSVARALLHEARCPVLAVPPARMREPVAA